MVPSGWGLRELKDLTAIYDGTHSTPKYVEYGVPFYSVEHLTKGDFSKTKFISEEIFDKENKRVKLERDDILMTRIGDIGTAVHLDWNVRASFYVSLALLKASRNFDSPFMTQYINSSEFRRELWKRIIHVAFPKKINLGEIGKCHVLLPPIPEQRKIAKILSTWDKAIITTERLIDNRKQQKKALMQQLLTGKKRLLDDAGKPFEGEWEWCTLDKVSDIKGGKRLPKGNSLTDIPNGHPYIRVADMFMGGVSAKNILYVPVDVAPSIKNYTISKDDLFITVAGSLGIVGQVPYILDGANLTENADKLTNISCNKKFLLYVLKSPIIQRYVDAESTQNAQPKLALTRIRSFKIPLPKPKEQQKIASVLSATDKEIKLLEQQLTDLKQEKKALMQQLLTGKRRVTIDSESAA